MSSESHAEHAQLVSLRLILAFIVDIDSNFYFLMYQYKLTKKILILSLKSTVIDILTWFLDTLTDTFNIQIFRFKLKM